MRWLFDLFRAAPADDGVTHHPDCPGQVLCDGCGGPDGADSFHYYYDHECLVCGGTGFTACPGC